MLLHIATLAGKFAVCLRNNLGSLIYFMINFFACIINDFIFI